jgi:hypothetical protein
VTRSEGNGTARESSGKTAQAMRFGSSDGMGKRPADKERLLTGESTGKAGGTGVEAAARQ